MVGRRSGTPDTRGEIITAARQAFAANGFDRTSLRSIARSAGVDPALIHHYFGDKDALFIEAMELPLSPRERLSEALDVPREEVGVTLIRTILGVWDDEVFQPAMLGAMRTLTSGTEAGQEMRKAFVEGMILPALRQEIRGGISERAVALIGSQIIGLIVGRYLVGVEPLAAMDSAELADLIGPTIQRYVEL